MTRRELTPDELGHLQEMEIVMEAEGWPKTDRAKFKPMVDYDETDPTDKGLIFWERIEP